MKSGQIRSFFWSVFSCIQLNTEKYVVSLRIQSECGKIRTRRNPVFGHFSRSGVIKQLDLGGKIDRNSAVRVVVRSILE